MFARIESMLARLVTRRLSEFTNDRRGMSAVEFALLLPLMVTLYLGGVELSQAISIDRKVTLTARTVADLVSQFSSIDTTNINASLGAASAVLAPYPDSKAKVTVSVVDIDANGVAKVKWSNSKNGTPRAAGSTVTIPAALNIPSTSLVWGEVSYDYQPSIGYVVTGNLNLHDQIFMRPRKSETIPKT
ncbi:TadE/TadG family type IV pilus assembly protein [Pseudorhodoplanes sp.]|uniref:TadE/TadG family type IV pilus assembly protein n=1 Tax=Pseudorhodoplanes sp. TaxID=1934341 RepID=UPI00391B5641